MALETDEWSEEQCGKGFKHCPRQWYGLVVVNSLVYYRLGQFFTLDPFQHSKQPKSIFEHSR
ncbi:Obelin [Clarias magur]|uniref:Obelin n=1 Tax=Clarias magur TaxID=1594786 RepID=A0A8J4U9Y4_CLAMG|nr:Obelin [Clarias magur]